MSYDPFEIATRLPTAIYPAAPVEVFGRQQVVYVPGPGGQMVGVLKDHLPTVPASLQSAVPVSDPWPKRILAGAAAAPMVGWGGSMLFGALAGATTAIGLLAACLALGLLLRGGGGGRTVVKVNVHNNTNVRR